MQFTININQLAWHAGGFSESLDLVDLGVFDVLKTWTNSNACEKQVYQGNQEYNAPYSLVIEQAPVLGLNTESAVYRRYKRLQDAGVLDMRKTRDLNVWIQWCEAYSDLSYHNMKRAKAGPVQFATTEGHRNQASQRTYEHIDLAHAIEKMQSDPGVREWVQRERGITCNVDGYMEEFSALLNTTKQQYYSETEMRKHFVNWLRKQPKTQNNNGQSTNAEEAVRRGIDFAERYTA